MTKILIGLPALALCISAFFYGLAVRLSNPDVTDVRIFLDYWWLWLVMMGSGLVAMLAMSDNR